MITHQFVGGNVDIEHDGNGKTVITITMPEVAPQKQYSFSEAYAMMKQGKLMKMLVHPDFYTCDKPMYMTAYMGGASLLWKNGTIFGSKQVLACPLVLDAKWEEVAP